MQCSLPPKALGVRYLKRGGEGSRGLCCSPRRVPGRCPQQRDGQACWTPLSLTGKDPQKMAASGRPNPLPATFSLFSPLFFCLPLPLPCFFFPFRSLFKRQGCPTWHLNPALGAAAGPPANARLRGAAGRPRCRFPQPANGGAVSRACLRRRLQMGK